MLTHVNKGFLKFSGGIERGDIGLKSIKAVS